jgi:hypothetical protein
MKPSRRVWTVAVGLVFASSVVWAVTGLQARDGAEREVAKTELALTSTRRDNARLVARLARAQATIERLQRQANVLTAATSVSQLDQQELGYIQRVLDAALAGDVGVYNSVANLRNGLDAAHDATVEALRNAVDTLTAQLATI